METRPYGNTGINLSMVGFGGLLVTDETAAEASRIVSEAIDAGINYFDVAPTYGNAEEMLGPALQPYRKDVFLACKAEDRTASGAEELLHHSLGLLKTDYFDLYQLHAVTTNEDVEQILGPGGALETLVAAREKGIVRHLGFSAHSETAAMALMDAFDFDSILFPVNWVTWNTGRFGKRVIDSAHERGLAILALKTLAKRTWNDEGERKAVAPKSWYHPVESYEEARLAARFTWSRPITAAVSPGHERYLKWLIKAANEFTPISEDEERLLAERARDLSPIFAV
jgi:aryl-alcohol dehydrogenase-like predicted oxidoreductase